MALSLIPAVRLLMHFLTQHTKALVQQRGFKWRLRRRQCEQISRKVFKVMSFSGDIPEAGLMVLMERRGEPHHLTHLGQGSCTGG